MILSNEPGYYQAGELRHPHREPCPGRSRSRSTGAERPMFGFETLTLAPIDLTPIEPALLGAREIAWLDAYHARVRETLSPLVDGRTRAWLEQATRPLIGMAGNRRKGLRKERDRGHYPPRHGRGQARQRRGGLKSRPPTYYYRSGKPRTATHEAEKPHHPMSPRSATTEATPTTIVASSGRRVAARAVTRAARVSGPPACQRHRSDHRDQHRRRDRLEGRLGRGRSARGVRPGRSRRSRRVGDDRHGEDRGKGDRIDGHARASAGLATR